MSTNFILFHCEKNFLVNHKTAIISMYWFQLHTTLRLDIIHVCTQSSVKQRGRNVWYEGGVTEVKHTIVILG